MKHINCSNNQPHTAHPFRSIDRTIKECPGVKQRAQA